MATLEVIEESLVWLYNKHKENHHNTWDLSRFVKSLGLPSSYGQTGLEANKQNAVAVKNNFQGTGLFNSLVGAGKKQPTNPAETMALTIKVLLHLKASKTEYFDLDTIPALQDKDWNQIGELTKCLITKNFIHVKGIDTKVYAQISQFGLQFLHACEATTC